MKRLGIVIVIGLLCALSVPALPWASEYTPEQLQYQKWPAGLVEVLASREWVSAYWCNSCEYFYYRGDTAAFNKFLEQFAQIKDAELILEIHSGKGTGTTVEGKHIEVDWVVTGCDWATEFNPPSAVDLQSWGDDCDFRILGRLLQPTIKLELWTGGRVDLSKVVVPADLRVENPCGLPVIQPGQSTTAVTPQEKKPEAKEVQCPQETAGLVQELNKTKVGQIALLIDSLSQGNSRLLISKAESAAPRVGIVFRDIDGNDTPFITVYPVSEPVKATLEGIGDGYILGAVTLGVSANSNGIKAQAGTYMLFWRTGDIMKGYEFGPPYVSLLSLNWEGDKLGYTEALQAQMEGHGPESGYPVPYLTVAFPARDEASGDNPAWRAHVDMRWEEQMYRFYMDLDIIML